MKAVEFRIWARSYVKHKGNFDKLQKIRIIIINLRSIRLNKDFHNKNKDWYYLDKDIVQSIVWMMDIRIVFLLNWRIIKLIANKNSKHLIRNMRL